MQPLFVDRPGKPDVVLDRCALCGGLWFDFGEVEQVAGREPAFERLDAAVERRCPDCGLTLNAGLFPGAVPVEVCGACRGAWLDWEDLESLGATRLQRVAKPPPPSFFEAKEPPPEFYADKTPEAPIADHNRIGFDCAKCGKRTPYSQANGTSHGLVCSACTPQPSRLKPDTDPSGRALTRIGQLVDALDAVKLLF